jgi:hypothetical protein
MKIIKIIFAVLAGLWALALIPKLIAEIDAPSLTTRLLGSIAGILIMTAISITLFKSAFKK